MNNPHLRMILLLLVIVSLLLPAIPVAGDIKDNVTRISVHDLKAKMDHHDGILIIDVRTGDDYARSKIKIKGAERISIVNIAERAKTLPREKEIVTYCT